MKQGTVAIADYEAWLASPGFAAVEKESSAFVADNRVLLSPYAKRWVADPLHQWSRAWEYPFVVHWLRDHLRAAGEGARALDAGSGITFFPFLLAKEVPGLRVLCVDQDASLDPLYQGVRHPAAQRVAFLHNGLDDIAAPNEHFDAIYCVSVLEHTGNYPAILDEFRRLLKPGGRLVVTCDVSLDGRAEISVPKLATLLDALAERFTPLDADAFRAARAPAAGVVDTAYVQRTRPLWLPWRYPRLSGALASVRQRSMPRFTLKQLTFICLAFTYNPR
jgi:2-polyprenyl-3-methyl-5-hydroxy-6-metoxy-1,4-benzoquinol methylase